MDLKTFLENFDVIAEAPGGIPKLRSLILDLAVRGKLVPQNPEDEPAKTLLRKIQKKRSQLISEKKIRKSGDLLPFSGKAPFDIPQNWEWSKLGNLVASHQVDIVDGPFGSNLKANDYVSHGIPILRLQNINRNKFLDKNIKFITREKAKELSRHSFIRGDVLVTKLGDPAGKACIVPNQLTDGIIVADLIRIRLDQELFDTKYITYAINSLPVIKQFLEQATGITRQRVNLTKVKELVLPLPPLAEQRRIVEKVDELMALCDRYEAAKQTRDNLRQKLRGSAIASLMNAETDEELDAAWAIVRDNWCEVSQCPEDVDDLRKTVLNLAVRGKLVSQNINDESVLDLLVRITDEKKSLIEAKKIRDASTLPFEDSAFPCEIPNTWAWKRFGDVILDIEAGTSPQCEKRPKSEDEWGVIKISAVSWNKFNPDENKALPANIEPRKEFEIKINDFIMSRANTSQLVGKSVVVEHLSPRLLLNDKTLRVLFPTCIEKRFFNFYNNSVLARQYYAGEGTGTSDSMKNITREQIRNLPVPVPPLHEQKRIIAKVDELMQLCDQLEASLRQSQQRAESLAASAISHLTI